MRWVYRSWRRLFTKKDGDSTHRVAKAISITSSSVETYDGDMSPKERQGPRGLDDKRANLGRVWVNNCTHLPEVQQGLLLT
ncbi:hypothetical protein EVAR_52048_1 [Eumeta japonica]|uniref:Uncharacterized protein n=1 Tax=Eumeta variegata TaxID=151549 RepID=A0A4C1Z9B9_EUMVA|nr:hypothetical protein EVAR_52048_1 [Eumeta japonica]